MSVVHFNSNPAYGIVRIERGNLGANSHRALRYVLGRPTTYVTNSTHAKLL